MDGETGEYNLPLSKRTDPETGEEELIASYFNQETGEQECYSVTTIWQSLQSQNDFKISRYATNLSTIVKNGTGKPGVFKSEEISSHFVIYLAFLSPFFMLAPAIGFLVVTIITMLHKWCHRQNSKLIYKGENSVYYKSPFHEICKEFCSKCIAEEECKKMCKIQHKRYNKRKYAMKESLRQVVA